MTRRIEGTLELDNGTLVRFSLSRDGYQQWGADLATLGGTQPLMLALEEAAEEWLNAPSTRHHTDCDYYQSTIARQDAIRYGTPLPEVEVLYGVYPCNFSCAAEDDGSDDYHETED